MGGTLPEGLGDGKAKGTEEIENVLRRRRLGTGSKEKEKELEMQLEKSLGVVPDADLEMTLQWIGIRMIEFQDFSGIGSCLRSL